MSARPSVVLPQPLSPMKAKVSPLATWKLTPRTALTVPVTRAGSSPTGHPPRGRVRWVGAACLTGMAAVAGMTNLLDARAQARVEDFFSERVIRTSDSWNRAMATGPRMYGSGGIEDRALGPGQLQHDAQFERENQAEEARPICAYPQWSSRRSG